MISSIRIPYGGPGRGLLMEGPGDEKAFGCPY